MRSRRAHSAVVLIWAGLSAIFAWQGVGTDEVQTRSGPYLPKQAFGFRVDSKLVETPVVVRDGHGRAVADLRRQDFEVYDAGKKREITAFSVQAGSRQDAAYSPAGSATGPSAGTNEINREPRFVALVFDDENMGFDNMSPDGLIRAVDAGVRFVKGGLSQGDKAAVFSLSQGSVSPLTANPSKLIDAMQGLRSHRRLAPPSPATGYMTPYDAWQAVQRNASGPKAEFARALWAEVESYARRLLGNLSDIVDFMGKLPGKRMVLLASPGFLTDTLKAEESEIVERAVRTGVVVNSLDVTGLWGGPPPLGRAAAHLQAIGPEAQQASDSVLSDLAYGTGGRFVHNSNDLLLGFRDLGAPPEVSYLLGFVPGSAQDGRYHKVRVRVNTVKHYAVQARPGYFAMDPDRRKPVQEREIDRAIMASDVRNDIPVRVTTAQDNVDSVPAILAVAHVDVGALQFRRVDDRRVQELTMIAALFDAKGNFVVGKEGGISFSLKESGFKELSKAGVNCTLTLLAPAGSYRMRTVVSDSVTGRMVASNGSVALR